MITNGEQTFKIALHRLQTNLTWLENRAAANTGFALVGGHCKLKPLSNY